jgi:hypothetical protein
LATEILAAGSSSRGLAPGVEFAQKRRALDRLRIDNGPGKSVMISPLERATFLRDLDARRKTAAR